MNTRHTLLIRRDPRARAWVVVHSDPRIRELFGTDTLPTPYTLATPARTVLHDVTVRNPDRNVYLEK